MRWLRSFATMNLAKIAASIVAVRQGVGGGGPAEVVAAGVVVGTAGRALWALMQCYIASGFGRVDSMLHCIGVWAR